MGAQALGIRAVALGIRAVTLAIRAVTLLVLSANAGAARLRCNDAVGRGT
jgi:hypothetical protein